MDTYEEEDMTKTELILSYITEHGPKTEYDLYKQFPKLSHGTIHFCLEKLAHGGALTFVVRKSGRKRRKKLHHLTFVGTVLYLASCIPHPPISEKMTASEMREPQMTRLKTSRPRSSVPKRCAGLGGDKACAASTAIGS